MAKNCLNCNKPLKNKPGKREKMYCNSDCRTIHWQKLHRKAGAERMCLVALPSGLWQTTDGKLYRLVEAVQPAIKTECDMMASLPNPEEVIKSSKKNKPDTIPFLVAANDQPSPKKKQSVNTDFLEKRRKSKQ
jgi:hypothetical protein